MTSYWWSFSTTEIGWNMSYCQLITYYFYLREIDFQKKKNNRNCFEERSLFKISKSTNRPKITSYTAAQSHMSLQSGTVAWGTKPPATVTKDYLKPGNRARFISRLSYSTVVLYIGINKVWGFWPKIITPKPAWYLLSDSLGALVRHSQAQKCLQINSKPLH